MIISRYLSREILYALVGVSVLLLLIFLSGTFVRILSDAAEGDYPADMVLSLFGLKALANLVLVLPLAFFLAILLALGRLYKDSEMTALLACGVSPQQVLRVVFVLALGVGAVVAALTLFFAPWAEEKNQELLDVAGVTAEIENVVPGRFNEAGGGRHVVYAEEISADRRHLYNVFVHSRQEASSVLLTAKSAHETVDDETGDRYLVLTQGYRYDGVPGQADYRIVQFVSHSIRIREQNIEPSRRRRQALTTVQLWGSRDPREIAELQRRVSVVLSTILLALIAVPLSKTNPRQGRYGRIFVGIMLYIIYSNLLTVGQAWVSKGKVPASIGMWWVHLLALALVAFLVARDSGWSWRVRRKAAA